MATTHSRSHSHMPDLSASLNDNTSCAPLSDLWNFPKSKLFPAAQQQAGPPPAPAAASPQLAATSGATPTPSGGSAAAAGTAAGAAAGTVAATPELSDSIAPIGLPPSDLKLGHPHSHPHPPQAFASSLWSRPGSSSAAAAAAGVAALDLSSSGSSTEGPASVSASAASAPPVGPSSVGAVANPPCVSTPEVTAATTPVVGPGAGAHAPSLLQLAPGGSPSTGSFRTQPAPRAGGIWGSEYPGFRHGHSAFAQPPASAGRIVSGPFSLQKTGPVRALDQQPPPAAQPVVSSLPVGLSAPSPAGTRSLDSSWDRAAFAKPSQPQTPTTAATAGTPHTTILSVHQQQQIHQQQQQQQQHRTQKKGGRPSTNTELYKTELCASYMSTGGNCPYGEKCQFAHGTQELKTVDRPPKWRSKPCQNWVKTGACSYNERCCFRHDVPVSPPQ